MAKADSKKKNLGCGCLTVVLVIIGIAVIINLVESENNTSRTHSRKTKDQSQNAGDVGNGSVPLPAYVILDEEVYDAPIKTQVTLRLLVSGHITDDGLRNLLSKLYSEVHNRRGFKYHSNPTHIFIYAYTDKERAESGIQWIAMLSKVGEGDKPKISVKDSQIKGLLAKPEIKFGLSENQRKQIWKEIIMAEDRASQEAEARYPLEPWSSLSVGQELRLTKETALMPELEPSDAMEAIKRIRRLSPRTTIKVLRVAKKHRTPWYFVRATSESGINLGSGWINSIALFGQVKVDLKQQLDKQGKLQNTLKEKYEAEVVQKHGITPKQLTQIAIEGTEKDWPFPKN